MSTVDSAASDSPSAGSLSLASMADTPSPLRIFYLEDNPLIIFHVEQMIEDLGHIFAGSLGSFCELKATIDEVEIDCALIDIGLSDGPTGPAAAEWLLQRGIPSIFVTGQEQTAAQFDLISLGTVGKPLTLPLLAEKLDLFVQFRNSKR
jgi:CheY-like chemotaxis protein